MVGLVRQLAARRSPKLSPPPMPSSPLHSDSTIWIVARDSGTRTALGRIAAAAPGRHEVIQGHPNDAIFDAAPNASVVVLGLSSRARGGNFEEELEFARFASDRLGHCAFILVAEADDHRAARSLFDTLDAELLRHPCDRSSFLHALARATEASASEPLSSRTARDHLAARFARWFGRNEPSLLARALAERHVGQPLLAVGERGTGRGLVLRYAHTFSAGRTGPILRIGCVGAARAGDLLAQLEDALATARHAPASVHAEESLRKGRWGIWLEDVDTLPFALQRRVVEWIELGLPGVFAGAELRWLASAGPSARAFGEPASELEPDLARVLGELCFETTPLRRMSETITPFVKDTSRAFSNARGEAVHRFAPDALDALRSEPWPGNLAELEAVVIRTLAHLDPRAELVRAEDLLFAPPREVVFPSEPFESPPTPEVVLEASLETSLETSLESSLENYPEPATDAPTAEPILDAIPADQAEARGESEHGSAAAAPATQKRANERIGTLQRLARAVAHEIRNPLVPIRTLAQLLPEHYTDEEFRTRFAELVGTGVRRIEGVVDQLQWVAEAATEAPTVIDVTALLEELLDAQRDEVSARRLLVLKELDRNSPHALGDPTLLREAFAGIIATALDEIPDQGDLYLASRHHASPPESATGDRPGADATLRVLLRYPVRGAAGTGSAGDLDSSTPAVGTQTLRQTSLAHAVAEAIVRAQGGQLTVDDADAAETVIVMDLPAPLSVPSSALPPPAR